MGWLLAIIVLCLICTSMHIVTTGTAANTTLTALNTAIGSTGFIMIYTGSAPAKSSGAFVAATGTLLASLACSSTASTTSAGVMTFNAITNATAVASGTPGYFRICTANADGTAGANAVAQGSAGLTSGFDINFSSTISSGGTVSITSLTITNPIYANAT